MCAFDAIVEPALSLISCAKRRGLDAIVVHPTSPRAAAAVSVVADGFEHVTVGMASAERANVRRRVARGIERVTVSEGLVDES